MLDPTNVPPVDAGELLARFVTQRGQFRSKDKTLKQDLFVPHPRRDLSVTRHRDATEEELWAVGRDVAGALRRTLYGRGDLRSEECEVDSLRVKAKPLPNNPNHADVTGWPSQKQDQKAIAIKLAAAAGDLIPLPASP
jgi:ribosomal protein S18